MTQLVLDENSDGPWSRTAWLDRNFWPVAMALTLLRMLVDSSCNLVPDEAFYWTWTRHLSTGYLDHPPMIAWIIWVSTHILGNTELGVRMPATLLSIGSLAVLVWVARQIFHDARAVGFVILMWITGPLLPVLGTIITPDAPGTFFSVCALAVAVQIARKDEIGDGDTQSSARLWLLFGVMCGLGFLSKYTTVLLPASVVIAMLCSPRSRHHFARPWIYLSGIVSLLIFSPCIVWNYHHHWVSFAFQLNHGAGGGLTEGIDGFFPRLIARMGGLGQFIGGQALVWTPILFGMAIVVIYVNGRKFQTIGNVDRLLLWAGALPLFFFGFMATRSHGEINWPAFAYFPLSLLIARFLAQNWKGVRVQWAFVGCEVALAFTIVIHVVAVYPVQQWLMRHHVRVTHQMTDLHGWNTFGRQLSMQTFGLPLVVCNRHQDAGEAAFYMTNQPDVWCDGVGSRITAFDFFDTGRPDYARLPTVAFVGGHVELFNRKWGYHTLEIFEVTMPGLGKNRGHTMTIVGR